MKMPDFLILHRTASRLLFGLMMSLLPVSPALALPLEGNAFTFQGRLTARGLPVNGKFDLRLMLFDREQTNQGVQIGPTLTNADVLVTNGLFTTFLDFGTNIFTGSPYWLEVAVRPSNVVGENFGDPLLPRQKITPAPYALYAGNAGSVHWTNLVGVPAGFADGVDNDLTNGVYGQVLNFSNAANSFAGNGAGLTGLNASNITLGFLPGPRLAGVYGQMLDFSNPSNSFAGNGAGLTGLNASNITLGVLPGAGLTGVYGGVLNFSNAANNFAGNGAGLTGLNASNLTLGVLPGSSLTGVYGGVLNFSNASNSFAGNGAGLTGISASNIDSGVLNSVRIGPEIARSANVWQLGGNGSTTPGTNFIGTTDANALELRVNRSRALRLEPTALGPNVIAGAETNAVNSGAGAATIGGGRENRVLAKGSYAAIPGGFGASARSYGQMTHASGSFPSGLGEAQSSVYTLRGMYGPGTHELFLDGAAERMVVPTNGVWTFDVLVVAATPTNGGGFLAQGVVRNDGSTTSLVGTNVVRLPNTPGAWSVEVTVNAADSALVIRTSSDPGFGPIRWVATVRTAELVFPPPP